MATDKATTVAPLFRLPPEIRNQIYSYLFPGTSLEPHVFTLQPRHLSPSLLSVNSRLRAEVSPLFYATTIFTTSSHSLCIHWLSILSASNRHQIQQIRFDSNEVCADNSAWRSAFRDFIPGRDAERRLTALKDELACKGVLLDEGVLRTQVVVNGREVWASEPMATAGEAVRDGAYLGAVMFV